MPLPRTLSAEEQHQFYQDAIAAENEAVAAIGSSYSDDPNVKSGPRKSKKTGISARIIWGFGCCYSALDCDRVTLGCHQSSQCLCVRTAACCALGGAAPRSCGMTCRDEHDDDDDDDDDEENMEEDECCKMGLYCCDISLVPPKVLCAQYRKCFCFQSVAVCPVTKRSAYMNKYVCAWVPCLACAPRCGCCMEAPECPAMEIVKAGGSVCPILLDQEAHFGGGPQEENKEMMDRGEM